MTVGVAIITHNAKKHLPFCLPPLLRSKLNPKILLVNSTSQDGTVEEAKKMGVETLVIPRAEFNHGKTRNFASATLNTDIVVMMTPDAYPQHDDFIEKLIDPILQKKASLTYARQLPHTNAKTLESFVRYFNYGEKSELRGLSSIRKKGPMAFFCSNSAAAYSKEALDSVGGFQDVLLGEDTLACAHLMLKGHSVAYVAEAVVKHSHSYTLKDEFKRAFDTGLARTSYDLPKVKSIRSLGFLYLKEMLKFLKKEKPLLIPYGMMHLSAKTIGYLIGSKSKEAPLSFKKRLSSQDFYWS